MFDPENYRDVSNWKLADLRRLPSSENDRHEYKSSKTPSKKLKNEIRIAASAFWNTGGGVLVAGLDSATGKPDGGFARKAFGKSVDDWVDQVLADVVPPGPYAVGIVSGPKRSKQIEPGHVILILGFAESSRGAHMAHDYKHYIRSNARSVPAPASIVEMLRSRVRPYLKLRFDWNVGHSKRGIFLHLTIHLYNAGGAVARFPGVFLSEPAPWASQLVGGETKGSKLFTWTGTSKGWWRRLTCDSNTVIFPDEEIWLTTLGFRVSIEAESLPDFSLSYKTFAIDSVPHEEGFEISGRDIERQTGAF